MIWTLVEERGRLARDVARGAEEAEALRAQVARGAAEAEALRHRLVASARHIMDHILSPCLFSETVSYNVASTIHESLLSGRSW
jgi:fructose-bisphosphate aldolase class 1